MKKLRKAYIALIMAFLYAPIVLLILYSFNDSKSRANWGGFTLRWYKELFSDAAIMSALGTTLSIGLLAADLYALWWLLSNRRLKACFREEQV